jgi:hypothetical protein
MAVTELSGALGGSNCVTQLCPEADRKAGFIVVFVVPLTLVTMAVVTILLITSRLNCAVTNTGILSLHRAYWRRQPRFQQVSVKDIEAYIHGVCLIVHHKSLPSNIMLQAGSRRELQTALALIEDLSEKVSSAKPGAS